MTTQPAERLASQLKNARAERPPLKVTLEVRCTTDELARRLAVLMATPR